MGALGGNMQPLQGQKYLNQNQGMHGGGVGAFNQGVGGGVGVVGGVGGLGGQLGVGALGGNGGGLMGGLGALGGLGGNGGGVNPSQPSTQQLRMLVHQIQMAVQAGYLNHQILNQPLAPTTLILLNQLLTHIKVSAGHLINSIQIMHKWLDKCQCWKHRAN